MKKVIWPILLFSFMIILAGCNVTNQEKENQNDENAVELYFDRTKLEYQ